MDDTSSDLSDPPSSPLSELTDLTKSPSMSPSFSAQNANSRYPSPMSSAPSGSASPRKRESSDVAAESICAHPDGGTPPRKRRRVTPKARTTEYLNLEAGSQDSTDEKLLDRLLHVLRKKKKIVVVAGAGISVDAGIPDFRSSNGLFKTLRTTHGLKTTGKQLFDASVYKNDDSTSQFHQMVRELAHQSKDARPTAFHHMVASIAAEGRLQRLYSQNVDGIDTAMQPLATSVPLNPKGPWPKTIQLHGGLENMTCSKCYDITPFDGSLFDGPEPPLCKSCEETDNVRTSHAGKRSHGIGRLRPRMVLYNEYNPDEEAIANVVKADLKARPDAVIVVGTSMKIGGVCSLVQDMSKVVRGRKDGVAAWINLDPEPADAKLKKCWDIVVQGKCDDVASLVGLPHWDETPGLDEFKLDEAKCNEAAQSHVQVEIPSAPGSPTSAKDATRDTTPAEAKSKSVQKIQGIPTPTASPKMRTALPTKPARGRQAQSQLSFSDKMPKTATSKGAKKPTQRKRQPKKPPAKPISTVKTAFKSTKATVPPPAPALAKQHPQSKAPKSSPKAAAAAATDSHDADFQLRPNKPGPRPDEHESDARVAQEAVDTQISREASEHYEAPSTPERPGSSYSLTISPPSKPHGMGALID